MQVADIMMNRPSRMRGTKREGWQGWDEYAPFYDWENAQTVGRADVPFWRRLTSGSRGRVLELGCGTGRISVPLARAGVSMVGIDRSAPMLAPRGAPGAGASRPAPRTSPARARRHPRAAVPRRSTSRPCSRPTASCSR